MYINYIYNISDGFRDVNLCRTSGLSSLQPDLTLSATLLKPLPHSEASSVVVEAADPDQAADSTGKTTSLMSPRRGGGGGEHAPASSSAIVKSKLGSILPEQITTNFLTNTASKSVELDAVDIERGRLNYFFPVF